jgi:hypothetical protein
MGPIARPRIETLHVLVTQPVTAGVTVAGVTGDWRLGMTKVLRAEDGLADWAVEYAKQRGVPTAEVVSAALRSFREDASRGVPELEPVVTVARNVVAPSGRCPSCGGRAFPHGGFQHKQTCSGYGRV